MLTKPYRYLVKIGNLGFSLAGRQVGERHEWFIGIETPEPIDCDDPCWGGMQVVSAEGMTDEELRSFGVDRFKWIAPDEKSP